MVRPILLAPERRESREIEMATAREEGGWESKDGSVDGGCLFLVEGRDQARVSVTSFLTRGRDWNGDFYYFKKTHTPHINY
jgi:hypothetical protein